MSGDIRSQIGFIPSFIPQLKSQTRFLGGAYDSAESNTDITMTTCLTEKKFLGDPCQPGFRLDYRA